MCGRFRLFISVLFVVLSCCAVSISQVAPIPVPPMPLVPADQRNSRELNSPIGEPTAHSVLLSDQQERKPGRTSVSRANWMSRQPSEGDEIEISNDTGPMNGLQNTNGNDGVQNGTERFDVAFSDNGNRYGVGTDFYSPPGFEGGLIIFGEDIAMKVGGYVKADFIYDFDPIDNQDAFVISSIPVGAAPRSNSRFHARQTRFSFDARWAADVDTIRIFFEGDFFSEGDHWRLRHAYGEVGSLLVGQTWTTFTDVAASPATLDFEGSVSSITRRQAQARWTDDFFVDGLTYSVAIEDTRFLVDTIEGTSVETRTPSPDLITRLRYERGWGRFQVAGLYRIVGIQPTGSSVPIFGDDMRTGPAWGLNFTGVVPINQRTKAYYQLMFGEGIGSYRGLPDAAPTGAETLGALPLFAWMVGITRDWTSDLSSNFTYAENRLKNGSFQQTDNLRQMNYLAANIIWSPMQRVRVGVEYLYGIREDVSRDLGTANRIQVACIFDLP